MKYVVTTVWEGTLDEEHTFTRYGEVERYAEEIMSLAKQEQATAEIYVLECTCDDDSNCQCVQYATSLQPAYSYAP